MIGIYECSLHLDTLRLEVVILNVSFTMLQCKILQLVQQPSRRELRIWFVGAVVAYDDQTVQIRGTVELSIDKRPADIFVDASLNCTLRAL